MESHLQAFKYELLRHFFQLACSTTQDHYQFLLDKICKSKVLLAHNVTVQKLFSTAAISRLRRSFTTKVLYDWYGALLGAFTEHAQDASYTYSLALVCFCFNSIAKDTLSMVHRPLKQKFTLLLLGILNSASLSNKQCLDLCAALFSFDNKIAFVEDNSKLLLAFFQKSFYASISVHSNLIVQLPKLIGLALLQLPSKQQIHELKTMHTNLTLLCKDVKMEYRKEFLFSVLITLEIVMRQQAHKRSRTTYDSAICTLVLNILYQIRFTLQALKDSFSTLDFVLSVAFSRLEKKEEYLKLLTYEEKNDSTYSVENLIFVYSLLNACLRLLNFHDGDIIALCKESIKIVSSLSDKSFEGDELLFKCCYSVHLTFLTETKAPILTPKTKNVLRTLATKSSAMSQWVTDTFLRTAQTTEIRKRYLDFIFELFYEFEHTEHKGALLLAFVATLKYMEHESFDYWITLATIIEKRLSEEDSFHFIDSILDKASSFSSIQKSRFLYSWLQNGYGKAR
ncbi:hypothetical protein SJAG_05315 [Schizosaccharomyces japonicus yFS275]|uniref:Uncharacterized protein n=1 Tax=Schizosaccharomyces japonicus (strain yFS275 / FY16936) TaxID=402676 RepID=B6K5H2_SCHJY|nr:hypothetical protein SJAG_05315 [Schizosaccharomyces japonicus yFS275]EEB08776.1 hypothetical protein SJAG_05315 [Schizosaccharomyces japonicus yFS275]